MPRPFVEQHLRRISEPGAVGFDHLSRGVRIIAAVVQHEGCIVAAEVARYVLHANPVVPDVDVSQGRQARPDDQLAAEAEPDQRNAAARRSRTPPPRPTMACGSGSLLCASLFAMLLPNRISEWSSIVPSPSCIPPSFFTNLANAAVW